MKLGLGNGNTDVAITSPAVPVIFLVAFFVLVLYFVYLADRRDKRHMEAVQQLAATDPAVAQRVLETDQAQIAATERARETEAEMGLAGTVVEAIARPKAAATTTGGTLPSVVGAADY